MRGMGIAIMMMSVVMFSAALENQKASLFMHEPSPSPQKNLTGTHMNTEPKTVHIPYTTKTGTKTLQIFLTVGTSNTRLYWKTMDNLHNTNDKLYTGIVAQRHWNDVPLLVH